MAKRCNNYNVNVGEHNMKILTLVCMCTVIMHCQCTSSVWGYIMYNVCTIVVLNAFCDG